jgi:hypothetical protein
LRYIGIDPSTKTGLVVLDEQGDVLKVSEVTTPEKKDPQRFIDITDIQIDQMKHALGLNYSKTQTRNYFYSDADDPEWNDLVEKGLAVKRPSWDEESAYFHVTEKGINLLAGLEDGKG